MKQNEIFFLASCDLGCSQDLHQCSPKLGILPGTSQARKNQQWLIQWTLWGTVNSKLSVEPSFGQLRTFLLGNKNMCPNCPNEARRRWAIHWCVDPLNLVKKFQNFVTGPLQGRREILFWAVGPPILLSVPRLFFHQTKFVS